MTKLIGGSTFMKSGLGGATPGLPFLFRRKLKIFLFKEAFHTNPS